MTLHVIDIGTPATVCPTRLRSIVESLRAQGVERDRIVAVGTATDHARAAGLDAGRVVGVRPNALHLARWTHGHGRVVAWGEWSHGVPDGVSWAERAPTSWRAVPPSSWNPGPGAPLVLWCGEPSATVCGLIAAEAIARVALLGCAARLVLAPGAARLDRARQLAHDLGLSESFIVLEDHAALATIAAQAAVAVVAPTIDGSYTMATQVGVPECLAAFAAAGTPCLAPHGATHEPWVVRPQEEGVNGLTLCLARLLGSAGEQTAAGARAKAAAAALRESLVSV